MNTEITTETSASDYIKALTEAEVEKAMKRLKLRKTELIAHFMDAHPELKDKFNSVQAAIYGNQAFPYVMQELPKLKKLQTA